MAFTSSLARSVMSPQIFEIFGLYCFAFTALAIDETLTQRNFLPSTIEIVSIYFPIKI